MRFGQFHGPSENVMCAKACRSRRALFPWFPNVLRALAAKFGGVAELALEQPDGLGNGIFLGRKMFAMDFRLEWNTASPGETKRLVMEKKHGRERGKHSK